MRGEDAVSGVKLKAVENGRDESLSLDGVFIAVGAAPETEAVYREAFLCTG